MIKYKSCNKYIFTIICVVLSVCMHAQDSIDLENRREKNKFLKDLLNREIRDKFPRTRFIDINYQKSLPTDYKMKLYGEPYEKGELDGENVSVSLNIPVFNSKRFNLEASGRYDYDKYKFDEVENKSTLYPNIYHHDKEEFHLFVTGINAIYLMPVSKTMLILNMNLSGEGSHRGYEKFRGSLLASLIIRKTKKTQMSVGFIGILDNKMLVPVLPTFSVNSKISDKWTLDFVLPRYMYFRRSVLDNSRITLGLDFSGKKMYFEPDQLNDLYIYRNNEIRASFLYEHHLTEKLIFTIGGGVSQPFKGKLIPEDKSYKDDILTNKQDVNFYFQTSFSYNLFSKLKNNK